MELSTDFVNKYMTQATANADSMGMLEETAAALTATVTSAGINTWNSLISIPEFIGADLSSLKVGTYDTLKRMNQNWANFYEDNKDSIETASFIAGSIVPAGLAMKGMKALQAGKYGFYPEVLTDAAQMKRHSEAWQLLAEAGQHTSQYRKLKNSILWADLGQQAGMAIGTEIAVLAAMNDAPLMEDYIKDPAKNFAISALFGTILGGALGHIITRNQIAKDTGSILSRNMDTAKAGVVDLPLNTAAVDDYQRMVYRAQQFRNNAENMDELPLARQLASEQAATWEAEAGKLRNEAIYGPTLRSLPVEAADTVAIQKIANDVLLSPYSFGANTIDIVKFSPKELNIRMRLSKEQEAAIDDVVGMKVMTGQIPVEQTDAMTERLRVAYKERMSFLVTEQIRGTPDWEKAMTKASKAGKPTPESVYYSPVFKAYVDAKLVPQLLHAVDIGVDKAETITIGRLEDFGTTVLFARNQSTAYADAHYVNALHTIAKFSTRGGVHIPDTDLAQMQGWISRLSSLKSGEEMPKIHLVTVPGDDVVFSQAGLKAGGREVSLTQLTDYMVSLKDQELKNLSQAGASAQEISIRLNVPLATIEEAIYTGKSIGENGQIMKYTDASKIPEYLSKANATMTLTTNEKKLQSLVLRNADMSANLDKKAIVQANDEILDAAMGDSKSAVAKDIYSSLLQYRQDWDLIREQLSQVNNENVGSIMGNSADFYLRRLGKTGETAVVLGQTMTNVLNQASETQLRGVVAKIRAHTASQVGNNEFNKVINILAGTSGYRNINEKGQLYRLIDSPVDFVERNKAAGIKDKNLGKQVEELINDLDGSVLTLTPGMQAILRDLGAVAKEQFALHNTINKIMGFKEMSDMGLHIPSFNPRNKFISYIIDRESTNPDQRVRLLVGRSAEHLADLERDWKIKFGSQDKRYELIGPKSNQEKYNFWNQRIAPLDMDFADATKFHSGASGQFSVPLDDAYAQTIVDTLHGRFLYYGKKIQQLYLSDIMDNLDAASSINQKFVDKQPLTARVLGRNQAPDAAKAFKNILLGNSQLDASENWQVANNCFTALVDYTSRTISNPLQALNEAIDKGKYGKSNNQATYKRLFSELESTGLKNPFKSFDDYYLFKNMGKKLEDVVDPKLLGDAKAWDAKVMELKVQETARRLGVPESKAEEYLAAGASLLTATALRILETGHAFVTMISWPILTLPTLYQNFAKVAVGPGVDIANPAKLMYDGVRFRWSTPGKAKIDQWISEGFGDSVVSEISKLQNDLRTGGKGAAASIDKFVNSKAVSVLSTPSEFMEKETRLWTLSTGYLAAKQAWPDISERNADMFAKAFLARAVGNYHAGQRPALFQGTFGTTIGLFQTYMLSWAQNAFRGIEEKNFKALSSQMLSQAGLFGMSSLPGYQLFSQAIGEHFSDKHFDLTTGTYRAVPEPLADFIIHGIPATLGIGLYTRGNIQPRVPFAQDNMLDTIAAVNLTRQTYAASAAALTGALAAHGMADKGRAILEGLSMQSISRPVARIVELLPQYDQQTGSVEALGSVTREGNTVGTSSMVWSVPGVVSRVLSSRSSEEQIKRDMIYLQSFYGSVDSENRRELTHKMKTSIRNGSLSEEKLDVFAEKYLRSGTASGFRSSLNEAFATTEGGVDYMLSRKLKDGSPFMQMVDHTW